MFLAWCLGKGQSPSDKATQVLKQWSEEVTAPHSVDLQLARGLVVSTPSDLRECIDSYAAAVRGARVLDAEVQEVFAADVQPTRPRSEQAVYEVVAFLFDRNRVSAESTVHDAKALATIGVYTVWVFPAGGAIVLCISSFSLHSGSLGIADEKSIGMLLVKLLLFSCSLALGWFAFGLLKTFYEDKVYGLGALARAQFSVARLKGLAALLVSGVILKLFIH